MAPTVRNGDSTDDERPAGGSRGRRSNHAAALRWQCLSNPPNERWQQIWDRIGASSGGAGDSTSGALTGSTRSSDTAPFSYTLSGLGTYSGKSTWSSSDYRAGQWGNGSYSFGSAMHDEHSEYSGDYVRVADFDRTATGTWVNVRTGVSTSGVNGTFLYSDNGSMTSSESGNSSGCYTLHEEGTYANKH